MSYERKKDQQLILDRLDDLFKRYKYDARSWWPKFVFHYSALQNVVSILKTGFVYSRNAAASQNLLQVDGASQSVLSHTSDTYKGYVRLYFRPKTPTQYSNEGIRPKGSLTHGAHCPVPVMLLFDARDILTRSTTQFSQGSLAGNSPGRIGSKGAFFERLPFSDIYHNASLPYYRKNEIKSRRHAEVIVPGQLNLEALKFIWCRSEAEKETLISSLGEGERIRWRNKIFHGNKYDLYFSRWSYVDRVKLKEDGVEFDFNPNSQTSGLFDLSGHLRDNDNHIELRAREESFDTSRKVLLNFSKPIRNYIIKLYMDGTLAYHGKYEQHDDIL